MTSAAGRGTTSATSSAASGANGRRPRSFHARTSWSRRAVVRDAPRAPTRMRVAVPRTRRSARPARRSARRSARRAGCGAASARRGTSRRRATRRRLGRWSPGTGSRTLRLRRGTRVPSGPRSTAVAAPTAGCRRDPTSGWRDSGTPAGWRSAVGKRQASHRAASRPRQAETCPDGRMPTCGAARREEKVDEPRHPR